MMMTGKCLPTVPQQVAVGTTTWFTSAATAYTSGNKTYTTADGSLKLGSSTTGSGEDASGAFKSTTLVRRLNTSNTSLSSEKPRRQFSAPRDHRMNSAS